MKSNSWLGVLVLHLVITFSFWWSGSGNALLKGGNQTLISLGRLSGLILVTAVFVQIMLITRIKWIEKHFGQDKLARIHHVTGYTFTAFLILHPLLLILGYMSITKENFVGQILSFIRNFEDVGNAALAFVVFAAIIFISLPYFRRKLNYEWWYRIHIFTYLATALAFGHQLESGKDFLNQPGFRTYWYIIYAFVFGNVLYYRFFLPIWQSFNHRIKVLKIVPETDAAISLYLTGDNIKDLNIRAGQFFIYRFLSPRFILEQHPFSVSCPVADNTIRLTPKSLGDFTSKMKEVVPGTPVLIDGPHGIFTLARTENRKLLFVAGGVGITPIRAMIEEGLTENRDMVLLYGNKNQRDIIFKDELAELGKNENLKIIHVLSDDPTWSGEKGVIDREKIISLVPDFAERDAFVCGPPMMMKIIIDLLTKLGLPKKRIYFEKFSF